MKKSKKVLLSILALNVAFSNLGLGNLNTGKLKYERMYNNIIKTSNNEKTNKKNYEIIERILNQKNKELKDLYFQSDYIVKPEYLEWQVFFYGFYKENKRGDNTLENADYYTTIKTSSGKWTIDINIYNKLQKYGFGEEFLTSLFNGEQWALDSLTEEQKEIFYGHAQDKGTFKQYNEKEGKSNIKLGATIPIKMVKDFSFEPQLNITEKVINPINITLPNTKVEKIMMADLKPIAPPSIVLPSLPLTIDADVTVTFPQVSFDFSAGHDGGAPSSLRTHYHKHVFINNAGNHTSISVKTNTPIALDQGYYWVIQAPEKFYVSNDSSIDITSENTGNGVVYFLENRYAVDILANYGEITITEDSRDVFIIGDSTENDLGTTTVYNSGTMNVKAEREGQLGTPGSTAMAYLRYSDGASRKYVINGKDGIINVSGWGNYGMLMNQVQNNLNTDYTDLSGNDLNILMNKGVINLNITGRPAAKIEGNIGLDAFTTPSYNDNSFLLNNSTGRIISRNGNNILMRHKGTGELWNKGVLVINSDETVGLQREHWKNKTNLASKDKTVIGINDGIIITKDSGVEKVKAVFGILDDSLSAVNQIVEIKNGDGIINGTKYTGSGTTPSTTTKGFSKGELGDGNSVTSGSLNSNPDSAIVSPGTTQRDSDPDLDNINGNDVTEADIDIFGHRYSYKTQDGLIFIGSKNSVGLMGELLVNSSTANYNKMKVTNEKDGKIFLYTKDNDVNSNDYTIGIFGKYAAINNNGGIFFGLIPGNVNVESRASDVNTIGIMSEAKDYHYIGIYGKASSIQNEGLITDKATSDNKSYSQKTIGIYAENEEINGLSVGSVVNNGIITLGVGGRGIVTNGHSVANKISLTNTGAISVEGDQINQGVGFTLNKTSAVISGTINLSGGKTIGIYGTESDVQFENLNINGTNVNNSKGIAAENSSSLELKKGVNINLAGKNNIGIFGDGISYTDGISGGVSEYSLITLGEGGIGVYIKDLASDITLKANTITTGNSSDSQVAGGIYVTSAVKKIDIKGQEINIGTSLENGMGFGIYAVGGTGTNGSINMGTKSMTVNQKSGFGIYADNITTITTGNVTAGNIGVYQNNSGGTGNLTTGKIQLNGNENSMIGLYTVGNITNVEIQGLEMTGLEKLTGIYVGQGGFKNTGNININSGRESYGVYIKGGVLNKTVDFGSGISNINLGDESLGLYLDNVDVIGNMPTNISVGDSSSSGKQSVGIYTKDTTFTNVMNTNVTTGKGSVGVYFDAGTGNVQYNGNIKIGENSLGIYYNGGVLKRDPLSSLVFTGADNTMSTGVYLNNAVLDFTSSALNTNTLSMNSGVAFLLKGNASGITVNGIAITPAQLDSLGLAPKVERIVYSEKNETITGDATLDPAVRYYGHRAKDGRLEINGNIYTNGNITSTYGAAVQNKYTVIPVTEEVLLNNGYVIDMSGSLGSVGIQALAGARAVNKGKIIVGKNSDTSAGIGILAESKSTSDLTKVENALSGVIEMPYAGIGLYLDSLELGGSVINNGIISSTQENALGIYAKMSSGGVSGLPLTTITNSGSISLSNNGFGIFTDNSIITNSGNITVDDPVSNSIIAIYGGKNSVINNNGGNISVGEGGIAFYGDNSSMTISGGTFSTERGTLIYGENNTNINYTANGTILGNKIGIYLDQSKIDLGGKDFTIMDSGSALYLLGAGAEAKSLGIMNLGSDSEGLYIKNGALNLLGGSMNIAGANSTGIIGINSNIENTTNINADISTGNFENKGLLIKADDGGNYTLKNKAAVNISGSNSLGIYGNALEGNGGTINIVNENNINMGSAVDISSMLIGIYGTKNVNISNTTGNISGGNYNIGIYSSGGTVSHDSAISLGDASIGVYLSEGTGMIGNTASVTIGDGIRKLNSHGEEEIENGVGFYVNNGAVLSNYASNITVGKDSIAGYVRDTGSKIMNYGGNILLGEEAIGFYVNSGEVLSNGTMTAQGDGIIYFYGKNGKIENNGNINGSSHNYGVGIYGENSDIVNRADIYLGDTYYNPDKADSPSDSSHRYAVGIYGDHSKIYNNGTISIGERGIGIYSYGQSGDLINDMNGKILSNSNNAVGLMVEGGGTSNIINRGKIILTGKDSVGVFINRSTTLINDGLIEVSGENSIGILAEVNSKVINNSIINSLGTSVAGIVLRSGSILENHGNITGLVLSDDENSAVSEKSTSLITVSNISGFENRLPALSFPSYTKPTIVNSGIINVDENFILDGIKLIIKPDLQNPKNNIISSGGTDFIYDAVKVNGGKVEDNMLVEVTPDFAEGTSSSTIQLIKVFNSSTAFDISNFDVISQSFLWSITPSYNKEDGTSIDLIASKKQLRTLSEGLWYEEFSENLDKHYNGSTGDALKIYNKMNWITSDKDLRSVMSSLAGNVYANINQREHDIAVTFEDTLHLLQDSSNNTKENVKISIIGGKGKTKEDTDGVTGYDYTTTGVLALREVERTYRHVFGYSLGYSHTGFEFKDTDKSKEKADTIQLGAHNKYTANGWFLKNDLTGRVSIHNMERRIVWPSPLEKSEIDGTYETYSVTSDNILGREYKFGKNVGIMPYGAFRVMYVTRPSFSEKGLENLEIKGNDAWSVKPGAGVELQGSVLLGSSWQLKGKLDFAYEYELANLNVREKARLTSIEDKYHKLSKPEDEKGVFKTKAAIGIEAENRYGLFLTGEYSTGSDKEDDYRAGVVLKAMF